MATKKKTEVEATEAVEEVKEEVVEAPVEEAPKKTTKKTSKKKEEEPVVEEAPVEEAPTEKAPEAEVAESPVEDSSAQEPVTVPEPETVTPKTADVVEEKKVSEKSDKVEEKIDIDFAVATSGLMVLSGPSRAYNAIDFLAPNTRVKILEVSGNWARIGTAKWVNINSLKKA